VDNFLHVVNFLHVIDRLNARQAASGKRQATSSHRKQRQATVASGKRQATASESKPPQATASKNKQRTLAHSSKPHCAHRRARLRAPSSQIARSAEPDCANRRARLCARVLGSYGTTCRPGRKATAGGLERSWRALGKLVEAGTALEAHKRRLGYHCPTTIRRPPRRHSRLPTRKQQTRTQPGAPSTAADGCD